MEESITRIFFEIIWPLTNKDKGIAFEKSAHVCKYKTKGKNGYTKVIDPTSLDELGKLQDNRLFVE